MTVSQPLLDEFGRFLETHTGLNLPVGRENALVRGMDAIARDLGCDDVEACIRDLMRGPVTRAVIGLLAVHFAIGETYFFREPAVFHALEYEVLPALIAARGAGSRRLHIWSAGCCSGEEAYSIAILLNRLIPDPSDWEITIVGTDIHPGFLHKAEQGIYREWSFRDMPAWVRQQYFEASDKGLHAVRPSVKHLVRFRYLNLIEDVYPSSVDLVLCRNVLMYFGPANAARVVGRLREALTSDGWLVTGSAEAGRDLFSGFSEVRFHGAVFYRRKDAIAPAEGELLLPRPVAEYRQATAQVAEDSSREAMAHARSCADLGLLADADRWCEAAIAVDKCNPGLRYLRATIAEQRGQIEQAMALLRQTIYLDQNFVLAHVALGGLCRRGGRMADARRHFANAARLLERYAHDEVLPESEDVSAGWLVRLIRATMEASHENKLRF